MESSDSEDSFHSVDEEPDQNWRKLEDDEKEVSAGSNGTIVSPLQFSDSQQTKQQQFLHKVEADPTFEDPSITAHRLRETGDPSPSQRTFEDLSKHLKTVTVGVPRGTSRSLNPVGVVLEGCHVLEKSDSSQSDEEDDTDVKDINISAPESSSEPSISDKDSGNEAKEWDRLSNTDVDPQQKQISKELPINAIDANLLDEWEQGWGDTELTDADITAVLQPVSPKSSPSSKPRTAGISAGNFEATDTLFLVKPIVLPVHTRFASDKAQSGGYWGKVGGWGTSLFSTATASVTSLSSQVGHGFSAVFETVEQTLGAPKPEELASLSKVEEKVVAETAAYDVKQSPSSESSAGWLSGLTTKVQSGSMHLVSNSLDVLEGIGKKTMHVVNEKDPGLRQTRALLTGKMNQSVLSQVLREANSTRIDRKSGAVPSKQSDGDQISFVQFFEEEQGTGSWEALELLCSQCDQRLQQKLRNNEAIDAGTRADLGKVEELCEQADSEDSPRHYDIKANIRDGFHKLTLGLAEPHKLIHVYVNAENFLAENSRPLGKDVDLWRQNVYRNAVRTLAACTAKSLEQIRKIAEMIYLSSTNGKQDVKLLLKRVECLRAIVSDFCLELDKLANQFAGCLALGNSGDGSTGLSSQKTFSPQITDIFVEASNSNRYLQDALRGLVPVFKLSLLESDAL